MLSNNTSVLGSWIDIEDFTATSSRFQRRVHNVTMAMPHLGVISAARDPINKILQPEDLAGVGEFKIRASVPSPAVNVICAGLTPEELEPFVYDWEVRDDEEDKDSGGRRNTSMVDLIFGFGEAYAGLKFPTFKKAPIDHNTMFNS